MLEKVQMDKNMAQYQAFLNLMVPYKAKKLFIKWATSLHLYNT